MVISEGTKCKEQKQLLKEEWEEGVRPLEVAVYPQTGRERQGHFWDWIQSCG